MAHTAYFKSCAIKRPPGRQAGLRIFDSFPDTLSGKGRAPFRAGSLQLSRVGLVMRAGITALASAAVMLTAPAHRAAPEPERDPGVLRVAVASFSPASDGGPVQAENGVERSIKVQLDKAIADEPSLQNREITFVVRDSDVIVTGDVRSEAEREKTNEIAMNVPGVRSVANALRVLP